MSIQEMRHGARIFVINRRAHTFIIYFQLVKSNHLARPLALFPKKLIHMIIHIPIRPQGISSLTLQYGKKTPQVARRGIQKDSFVIPGFRFEFGSLWISLHGFQESA